MFLVAAGMAAAALAIFGFGGRLVSPERPTPAPSV
jgi:hypothetical protein